VPHSALDRVSPRLPPFILTVRSPFRAAFARAAYLTDRNGDACLPLQNLAEPRREGCPATSPGRGSAAKVPSNG